MLNIKRLDHLVLTVQNIDQTIHFYCNVLGMKEITFKGSRKAIQFGKQKITPLKRERNLIQKPNTLSRPLFYYGKTNRRNHPLP